ncbi:MAG: hypothetical protein ABUK01_13295 [Leptospirales bacterium]
MSVKPLDLQVNMQSVMETSKAQGVKQAAAASEQRLLDERNVEDSKKRGQKVNETPKSESSPKLKDTEDHFGNKTEAELEQEYSDRKQKKKSDKNKSEEKTEKNDGHINFLA